jgi:hypothetical protein
MGLGAGVGLTWKIVDIIRTGLQEAVKEHVARKKRPPAI